VAYNSDISIAVFASKSAKSREMSRKFVLKAVQSYPRSSTLMPKRICNFLLVNNINSGRILYRFRDIDA